MNISTETILEKKVLKVRKYHYLYNVSDPMIWNGHIDESVFALSFQENVVVFNESKDKRQHRSSVFACVYSTPNDTGVGIVSVYFLSGFARTFFEIDEIGSTLSYIYEKTSWRESDRNGTNNRTK